MFAIDQPKVIPFLDDDSQYPASDPDSPLPPRKSGRISRPPSKLGQYQAQLAAAPTTAIEPETFVEETTGEYQKKGTESTEEEYVALMDYYVWDMLPRPSNKKVVGSSWHYVHTLGPTGEITRRKSRFVAKRYFQVRGIDYEETFSLMFRYEFLRTLFALVVTPLARCYISPPT